MSVQWIICEEIEIEETMKNSVIKEFSTKRLDKLVGRVNEMNAFVSRISLTWNRVL